MENEARELRVKTGAVKRLIKEKLVYEKEAEVVKAKLKQCEENETDDYVLRKQKELMKEAEMMVPDAVRRLTKIYKELKMVVDCISMLSKEDELYIQAVNMLKEAEPHVSV